MQAESTPRREKPWPKGRAAFWTRLMTGYAMCHAIYLVALILPPDARPVLQGRGWDLHYRVFTGCEQHWNMFETIPHFHRFNVMIVVKDAAGAEREIGPVLPGFRPFADVENARVHCILERMMVETEKHRRYRLAYIKRVDEELRRQGMLGEDETWTLRYDVDYTRHLFHIRKDGRLGLNEKIEFGLDGNRKPKS